VDHSVCIVIRPHRGGSDPEHPARDPRGSAARTLIIKIQPPSTDGRHGRGADFDGRLTRPLGPEFVPLIEVLLHAVDITGLAVLDREDKRGAGVKTTLGTLRGRLMAGHHLTVAVGVDVLKFHPEGSTALTPEPAIKRQDRISALVLATQWPRPGLILRSVLGDNLRQRCHIAGRKRLIAAADENNIRMFTHALPP
jgi:hypothetical protein